MTRPARRRLFAAVTALLSLSVCFFGLELFGRFFVDAWPFSASRPATMPYLTAADETLKWRFEPHKDGRNSLGLRNPEVGTKPENTLRVLFLGDSMVFSGDTSSGKLYTEVVAERLNTDAGDGPDVEIVNAGVPGYTTYQEREFLEIYGLDMDPDAVVLGFVLNDLFYKYLHTPTDGQLLGDEPSSNLNRFSRHSVLGRLFSWSYAAHGVVYALEIVSRALTGAPEYPFESRSDFYLAWKPHGWEDTRRLLAEMKSLLDERGIPLSVVVFPVTDQVDERYLSIDPDYVLYPQRRLEAICERLRIGFYDLHKAIYEAGGTTLYRDYLHLNGTGNDVVAAHLVDFFREHVLAGTEGDTL